MQRDETEVVLSRHQQRIGASIDVWDALRPQLQAQFPTYAIANPFQLTHQVNGWSSSEVRCIWTDDIPTLMPLCDVVELASLSAADFARDRRYLTLDQILGNPLFKLASNKKNEILFFADFTTDQREKILALAATVEPAPFLPPER